MPVSGNSLEGAEFLGSLAEVLILVGEHDRAIDRLEQVLSVPSRYTAASLKADPLFDPLRDHPRFQALLERFDR